MERALRHEPSALVVDDDMHVRALLAEIMEEQGFDVITASNGFSGLRLASERHPRLIVLDLALPELSGAEVLRELRAAPATRDTAVLVVTGAPHPLSESLLAEVDALVRKPFDVAELIAGLQQALQHAAARRASEVQPVGGAHTHPDPVIRRRPTPRHTRGRR
jgi:DNA-binding response OmpR family regulator